MLTGEIFVGKTLAAMTFTIAMVALLSVSSIAAGMLVVGTQPLVSLSGELLSPGRALALCLESWAVALIPTLAFTCLAVLLSVASRNSMVGVLGPPVIGLVMVLLSLMGSGVVVSKVMLTTGFTTWHGLLVASPTYKPLLFAVVVALAYAYLCLDTAYTLMRRRDFAGDVSMRATWPRTLRGIAVALVVVGALAVASTLDPTWITSDRLQASVGPTFKNLVVDQQALIGRPANSRTFNVYPFCKRESMAGGPSRGSGDDWICSLSVNGPQLGQRSATYNLVVRPDGCYTAEGPASVVGPLHVRDAQRRTVINPLFAFDGCIISP